MRPAGRIALVVLAAFALPAAAATLFPEPLHLVRRIEDPISRTISTIDQYCAGNRVVTVRGPIVSIADYARGEITTIDRNAATYSVISFSEVAKGQPALVARVERVPLPRKSLGARLDRNGTVDVFEIVEELGGGRVKSEVAIDRSVRLSREAVEVLIGAAHPRQRTGHHDAILQSAASTSTAGVRSYGLPAQQITTYEVGGEKLSTQSELVSVTREDAPPELLVLPPGAIRVESSATALPRLADELDGIRRR